MRRHATQTSPTPAAAPAAPTRAPAHPGFAAYLREPIASDLTFFWCSVVLALAAAGFAMSLA